MPLSSTTGLTPQVVMTTIALHYLHLAAQVDATLRHLDELWEQLTIEERTQVQAMRQGNCPQSKPDRDGAAEPVNVVLQPHSNGDGTALSAREQEILRDIARGFTNKEIAAKLKISVKTIETYKARGGEKLGLRNRVQLIRHALDNGWLADGEFAASANGASLS